MERAQRGFSPTSLSFAKVARYQVGAQRYLVASPVVSVGAPELNLSYPGLHPRLVVAGVDQSGLDKTRQAHQHSHVTGFRSETGG